MDIAQNATRVSLVLKASSSSVEMMIFTTGGTMCECSWGRRCGMSCLVAVAECTTGKKASFERYSARHLSALSFSWSKKILWLFAKSWFLSLTKIRVAYRFRNIIEDYPGIFIDGHYRSGGVSKIFSCYCGHYKTWHVQVSILDLEGSSRSNY